MHLRQLVIAACIALAAGHADAEAQTPSRDLTRLFHELQPLTSELDRYEHLMVTIPLLDKSDQLTARQLLAACESELGLYNEAVRDFPLRNRLPAKLDLPDASHWQAVNAVDAITGLARERRLVMINEAHHDGHTRELTLYLLPRLRALGFKYFAPEALGADDAELMQRGYPVTTSGSEYLHDPIYGEIIREAIRLGYIIVPYDLESGGAPQERENTQARNLYRQVFAKDPQAKLFVHAGYAHIDKRPGRLGQVRPMAMTLRRLSGIEPLSIDQTDIRETPKSETDALRTVERRLRQSGAATQASRTPLGMGPSGRPTPVSDPHEEIIATFQPTRAIVLQRIDGHEPWSASPGTYDVSVILPSTSTSPSDYRRGPYWLTLRGKRHAVLPPANQGRRPDWLTLAGQRVAVPVDSRPCTGNYPCLVEAHYATESSDATAADRYLFLRKDQNTLYLRPGSYRLRTIDSRGQVVDEHTIQAGSH